MTVSAVRPWRSAFRRDCSLPSSVFGPVLRSAFLRLASICRNEVIGRALAFALFDRNRPELGRLAMRDKGRRLGLQSEAPQLVRRLGRLTGFFATTPGRP